MMRTMHSSALAIAAFASPAPAPNKSAAEIAAEIQQAFEAYKAKNDERLAQAEKRGEDAVTKAELAKIDADLDRLSAQLGRLTVGGPAPANGNDPQANARKFFSAVRGRALRPSEQVDVAGYSAYVQAFDELVLGGANPDTLKPDVRNALSVGTDRDGGFFVPPERSNEIERRIYETSPMRQVARVIPIGSDAWEAPFKSSQGASGGWVGEKGSRPATNTPTVGMQRIEAHEQYAYPEVTQRMLDDGMMNVEQFLSEETEDVMGRTENTAFVSGNGVMKPRGFLDYTAVTTDDATRTWGQLQYIPTGAAAGFPKVSGSVADNPDCLITTIAKLNPVYLPGAAWAMSRLTASRVRRLKDADGRYLVGFGDIRDGVAGFTLLGFPIVNMEDMPTIAADSMSIAFGNWRRAYYIVDRAGFRLLRDPYTNKPYVGFYITKRTGGDVRNFDALKLVKFAAS